MSTPLEDLTEAVQAFVNAGEDHAAVVTASLLVWEVTRFNDDGEAEQAIRYAVPGEHASMAAAAGLADLGRQLVLSDILDDDDDEERP